MEQEEEKGRTRGRGRARALAEPILTHHLGLPPQEQHQKHPSEQCSQQQSRGQSPHQELMPQNSGQSAGSSDGGEAGIYLIQKAQSMPLAAGPSKQEDDTALLATDKEVYTSTDKVQRAMNKVIEWTNKWKLMLNQVHLNFTKKVMKDPPSLDSDEEAGGGDNPWLMSGNHGARQGRRYSYCTALEMIGEMDYIRLGKMFDEMQTCLPNYVRIKQGTHGKGITLTANYFPFVTKPDWCLYWYKVDFSPMEVSMPIRKALLNIQKNVIAVPYIFDGVIMFTSHKLTLDPMELFSKRDGDKKETRITIKLVENLHLHDGECLHFFNILTRKILGQLDVKLVGTKFLNLENKSDVREFHMEVWPGIKATTRQHEDQILMCAELVHTYVGKGTVLDVFKDIHQKNKNIYNAQYRCKELFSSTIIGSIVMTVYNNKTYKVDDVQYEMRPDSYFETKSGRKITFIEFYKERYNIDISTEEQPLLVYKCKKREIRDGLPPKVLLIPELCKMTGLTDGIRSNFSLMRALAIHTGLGPEAYRQKIIEYQRKMTFKPEITNELQQWNLELEKDLVKFPARILGNETLIVGNEIVFQIGPDTDWTKFLRTNPMFTTVDIKNWVCVTPRELMRETKTFVETIIKQSAEMRLKVEPPRYVDMTQNTTGAYVEKLEFILQNYSPSLIMCIVRDNRSNRYSGIKKKCTVDRAVPTQVVVAKTIFGPSAIQMKRSIVGKMAIQMNCKVGGSPWTIQIPLSNVMVVGFDVCRDSKNKQQSYGALVASLNNTMTQYFSAVSPHKTGDIKSSGISLNIVKAIKRYQIKNGYLPDKIVIYRDGVGDQDIIPVHLYEVKAIVTELKELYSEPPRLAFIIVNRKTGTRLFFQGNNPPPGTVVDSYITRPQRYDFFLVSQSVRQGTVSPTLYNVIYDTLMLGPDKIQRLTYKLTHLYFNWAGTVAVPAACQYAHKLAFLVAKSLHAPPNVDMDDVLFFL